MKKYLMACALVAGLSAPALAASSSINTGAGITAGFNNAAAAVQTHGLAAGGAAASQQGTALGTGFSATTQTPLGAVSTTAGVGAAAQTSNAQAGVISAGNGGGAALSNATGFNVGAGFGFHNTTP
jgi:hypothetical protein